MSSYNILLTDGASLTSVSAGSVDTTTTSMALVGQNYAGYGQFLNTNFIHLLENSSNPTAPVNPLVGQLWWDSISRHLNVYQGTGWKVISSSMTGASSPSYPVTGDFWWDTGHGQLNVYNGSQWSLVGPATPAGSALTGMLSDLVSDTNSSTHYVGNLIVNNKLAAVYSAENASFNLTTNLGGLTTINPGLNMVANTAVTAQTVNTSNITVTSNANIGNLTTTTLTVAGAVNFEGGTFFTNIQSDLTPTANLSYNLGSMTNWWNNIYGTSIHAQYADLAERFESDAEYEAGTVVELGGDAEITAVIEDLSDEVFGVISTNAAFVMNSRAGDNTTHPPVAVQGRVPVKVIGQVRKGDRLVSAGSGYARAGKKSELTTWNVIGRALEDKSSDDYGLVEAVVKINS
jgi:hypothetical protein